MGEHRFKVGDWVRVKDNCGDIEVGKVYQIPHLDGDGEPWFTPDGTGGWSDYLTLDEIEPWQPRVGERVKVTGNDQWAGDGEVIELRNYGVFVVLMKTGRFAGKPGGFYIRDIEPIITAAAPEQPAALKIEAGKFYRTRDGRKVGPMIEDKWHDRDYGWTVEHEFNAEYGKAWRADGTFHIDRSKKHKDDLIAEWIDEPVAKPCNDNEKPKFKVGDVVQFKQSYSLAKWRGAKATVIGVNVWGDDGIQVDANGDVSTESEDSLEHIVTTTTIVALIENGQPKPSSTPHVHASTGAAEKEAKRLAAKYKGKQFGVFTLTTTHHEPKPVYDHKWQNMAALGLKIDAIKELRAVAGLDLLSAKRAVEAFEQAA